MNDQILENHERIPTKFFRQTAIPCLSISACHSACPSQVELGQIRSMHDAFGRTGGLVSGDEAAQLLRKQSDQPISTLARWIVSRKIVNFEWQSQTLVPLFQFNRTDMLLDANTVGIVRELVDVFNDWELAVWFAQSNAWLNDAAPCELISTNAAVVLQAARADRFIARG